MKCECGGEFKITGDISDDKDICPHIVIRCVECEKAHNIFYFKDLAEEMEAKAEKAEALNFELYFAFSFCCKFREEFRCGDRKHIVCRNDENKSQCRDCYEETCPIVAKAKEG